MSTAFRLLLAAREKLYTSGVFRTSRLSHPVISVGNLTLGGTGKTPLVIALAGALRDRGYRAVILSRGYGRSVGGTRVVGRGRGPIVPWESAGDEPYLMALRLEGVSVVVGSNRYKAGLLAEREGLGNLFILDDGFQHRRLHRDVDILVIDPEEWQAAETLLPLGPWREPKSAIRRAHVACVQISADGSMPSLPIPSFVVETRIDGIIRNGELVPAEPLRGKNIVAFAGISKPDRFFRTLESLRLTPSKRIVFRDHHHYRSRDMEKLQGEVRITTEKDAVRLPDGDFFFVRISANIPRFERLLELIGGLIRSPSRSSAPSRSSPPSFQAKAASRPSSSSGEG